MDESCVVSSCRTGIGDGACALDRIADIDVELVIKMMQRESDLRRSDEAQILFDEYSKKEDGTAEAIELLQRRVLEEFGFPSTNKVLRYYQTSRYRFASDPRIVEAALYIKYDRSCLGELRVGNPFPSPTVHFLDGTPTPLSVFENRTRPLVIVGGSYT
eukprot:TRINITY_DN5294_c0_g1_i1.p1 TRINITY_DN5294_c0_g1~~TRINITY_DN5294_c0_g1_i1.p1  ORF type:complete len:159 (-),score=18.59 TRINITY_DN5294_c0_g1_i1:543-1019(-)